MAIAINKNQTDEEIIQRILDGEKHLFELLIKKYNQRLYRVGMAILHDDEEVEEVMQSAYIKAYENMPRFEHKSSFATWLTRILINDALMTLRKKKNNEPVGSNVEYAQVEMQHPMNALLNEELKHILENAVARLPLKYRIVFMMREIDGMSTAETTQCLSISESNVKVRLNRAKEMLRNNLSHYIKKEDIYSFHLTRCDRIRKNVMTVIETSL